MRKKKHSFKIYSLFIPLLVTFLLFVLSYFLIFIPSFENSIIDKKKELIKEVTGLAWDIIDFYNSKVEDGTLTIEEAQQLTKQEIEIIKYGKEKKDYLWINDYQPKMIMHPYKEELNNQDLSSYQDFDGKYVFNDMVDIALRNGEGYLRYKWQLKDDTSFILPKISYIKAYKPWNWIIGTGVYLTDIEKEVLAMKTKLGIISVSIVLIILSFFVYIIIRGLHKERLLEEVEIKYKKLFNFSNDAIILWNSKEIVNCNPKALNLFNCEREDMINKTVIDFSPEYQPNGERSDVLFDQIIQHCIKGESQFFEWIHYTCTRKVFIAEVSINAVEIGNEIFFMSSIRDITERKENEKKLIEALKKAENADKLKSAFLANMSHEIRTPMNGILGFSQLIRNNNLSLQQRNEFIDIINSKGNQLLQIINDIIDISKIESNQIQLYYSEFSINKMFDEIYYSFRTEANEMVKSNIEFVVKKEMLDKDSFIKSDKNRITQILYNLLSNAFKYSTDGTIELGYKVKESEIEFYVSDNGIGVNRDHEQLIFERFTQADGSTRRLYGGTGLGLSISKGLVELLGGKIGVEPNKNTGSKFYFTIPYKFVSKSLDLQLEDKYGNFDWSNKKFLVVEDDYISFEYLKELLSYTKAELTHVKNGDLALKEFKQNKFDLILMDIQLPGIDGYQITNKIRKIDKNIPIIAQTANAFGEDRTKSLKAGCNDYISKPIDRKLLVKIIDHYI